MQFDKNRGCVHSPPWFASKNKHIIDEQYDFDYSLAVGTEEQRVHDIIALFVLDWVHRFYTYTNIQVLQDERVMFRFKRHTNQTTLSKSLVETNFKSNKEVIHILVYSFMYLCETLEIMAVNKLVHGHLNLSENIVTCSIHTNTCPQIADISLTFDDIIAKPYDPTNMYIPLECHILQYITRHRLQSISEQNVEDVVYDVYTNHPLLDSDLAERYAVKALSYLYPLINCSKEQLIKHAKQTYNKWDQFALCANYMNEFHKLTMNSNFNCVYKKQRQMCIQLFIEEMHPIPGYRSRTALDLKIMMNKIFCCKRV